MEADGAASADGAAPAPAGAAVRHAPAAKASARATAGAASCFRDMTSPGGVGRATAGREAARGRPWALAPGRAGARTYTIPERGRAVGAPPAPRGRDAGARLMLRRHSGAARGMRP